MESRLWPVEQVLGWLDTCEKSFIKVTPIQRLIILALLKFADNKSWSCYPSVTRLSNLTGLDKRTIERNLTNLEKLAVLKITYRNSQKGDAETNLYNIYPMNLWGVGAWCRYPPGRAPVPPRHSAPLTTNITTQVSNQQAAPKKEEQKMTTYYVDKNTISQEFKDCLSLTEEDKAKADRAREEVMTKLGRRKK